MTNEFDVVVLGGGPCGLAAATALAMLGRRVGVFERNRFGGPRVGETFGPEILKSLHALGVIDEFSNLDKVPFRGVQSAWGADELVDRPSIVHPLGEGFHVDRASFDALLLRRCDTLGIALRENLGIASIESTDRGWRLLWPNGIEVSSRFLMDASGRGAPASARGVTDRNWIACDRAIGVVTRFVPPSDQEFTPELLIETAEIGWWYIALQPGPELVCILLTDIDLIGANHRTQLPDRWQTAFDATKHVRALCAGAKVTEGPRIVRADTGFLWPNKGPAWCAIGDAAFASDPLSGDGVMRGLSGAIDAARDIDTKLAAQRDSTPAPSVLDPRIPAYLDRRMRYYRMEQRWPNALFWKRRHALDWASAPITLDPRLMLVASGTELDMSAIAAIEGLIPPRALRTLLERCRKPHPAHEVLGWLRSIAPLGDRRLLVALQELVARGPLRLHE